jgi:p-aminobenzoyl-glutamate transporter AbgT
MLVTAFFCVAFVHAAGPLAVRASDGSASRIRCVSICRLALIHMILLVGGAVYGFAVGQIK